MTKGFRLLRQNRIGMGRKTCPFFICIDVNRNNIYLHMGRKKKQPTKVISIRVPEKEVKKKIDIQRERMESFEEFIIAMKKIFYPPN